MYLSTIPRSYSIVKFAIASFELMAYSRDMDSIKHDLTKRLNARSLATTATAAYICHVANERSQGRYVAVSYRNGILTLAAPTAGAAQNLKFQQKELSAELSAAIRQPLKLRIIVRVPVDQ